MYAGNGATPSSDGLHGGAPPERGTFFRLHVHKRGKGFQYVMRMKGWENLSVRSVKGPERANWRIYGRRLSGLVIYSYLKRRCINSSENGCSVLN